MTQTQNESAAKAQIYTLRDAKLIRLTLIVASAALIVSMLGSYLGDRASWNWGIWISCLLPIAAAWYVALRRVPLRLDEQGITWQGISTAKGWAGLRPLGGFVPWSAVEMLERRDHRRGVRVEMHYLSRALRFPDADGDAVNPDDGEKTMAVLLHLNRLGGNGEAIFAEMQRLWQRTQP